MLQQISRNEAPKSIHPIRHVFWAGLNELLEEEKVSLDQFCDYVQRRKGQASFSSTMRAQILEYFRRR